MLRDQAGTNEVDGIHAPSTQSIGRPGSGALISVTMEDGAVVVRPIGRLDADTVTTLTELMASARAAGSVATLDVSGVDPRDRRQADELVGAIDQVTPVSVV